MASEIPTCFLGSDDRVGTAPIGDLETPRGLRSSYHRPTRNSTTMAASASNEHQARLDWPRGTTKYAASSGPSDDPKLPPTCKSDCDSPCCPPDATRATRDDSGWNTADPTPMRPVATRMVPRFAADDRRRMPTSDTSIPITSEYGVDRRSV